MKAIWNGAVIAESDDTVVVEGNHYFPLTSIDCNLVAESDHTSRCAWKGKASYFDIVVGDARNPEAAWYYPDPSRLADKVRGRVAFWRGVEVVAG